MSTDLKRIGEKATQCPGTVFTSLYHHVTDVDNLRECYEALDGRKAVGVDGVTKEMYGVNLDENLQTLSKRLKAMAYKPKPKRRTYIPKAGSDKKRPLGISCFEDKIVERAVKQVLEPVYEAVFEPGSYGYRPGRSQHDCVQDLSGTIQKRKVNYVVEADIRGFFDNVNHNWLLKFLSYRIGDKRTLRLIHRMLKSGVMEDGLFSGCKDGTPQGSIISPLLSNIYLHCVVDLWHKWKVSRWCRGETYLFRYADDFVTCFQYKREAEEYIIWLRKRLERFKLELAEEKTNCLEFGRFARENSRKRGKKPKEFTFLGFTFYSGKTRNGYFKVKRRTSRKKFRQSLLEYTLWAKQNRSNLRKGEMIRRAKARVNGHLQYFGITDNGKQCGRYLYQATRILFKWINRKSQRRAYTWEGFSQVLKLNKWPRNNVRVEQDPCEWKAYI